MASSTTDGGGRVVLLLRDERHPRDAYKTLLEEHGFVTAFVPVLDFSFIHQDKLSIHLQQPNKFCGIVLTSQVAVQAIAKCLESDKEIVMSKWNAFPVFVVGVASGNLVKSSLGLTSTCGDGCGNAESLAQFIVDYYETHPRPDMPLLFPCGNISSDTIPNIVGGAGILIYPHICYETVPHPLSEKKIHDLVKWASSTSISDVVFFSPSGVKYSYPLIERVLLKNEKSKVIAIGPSTAQALRNMQAEVDVACKPTPTDLLTVINSENNVL